MKMNLSVSARALGLLAASAAAITIAEINGNKFKSPYSGMEVTGVTGVVTVRASDGFYLRSLASDNDNNPTTSESLFVGARKIANNIKPGVQVTLDGHVELLGSSDDTAKNLPTIRLVRMKNVNVAPAPAGSFDPLVIGVDTPAPPTRDFSSLDGDSIWNWTTNSSDKYIMRENPMLSPEKYGLDFWKSLHYEYATILYAYVLNRPTSKGGIWVRGNWPATGVNGHRGLTLVDGDANPEAILIGSPLDGTHNPSTKMGDGIHNITGVVVYQSGHYQILPLTRLTVSDSISAEYPATNISSAGNCRGITMASYNVNNLNATAQHMAGIAAQIATKMGNPDLIFLQEVQDDSGVENDGVVSANRTLETLVNTINSTNAVRYDFADVEPVNNQDGGQPGANIRNAYLYRPDRLELHRSHRGSSNHVTKVLDGPALSRNPGRLNPCDQGFHKARKPLAAAWKAKDSDAVFFTVNVHLSSKRGSGSLQGNRRPPLNNGVGMRIEQATIVADFVKEILDKDPQARVVVAGDFNEFKSVAPLRILAERAGLRDMDEVVNLSATEQYSYVLGQNSEALDHVFATPALTAGASLERLHLNTWQPQANLVSDHDPILARFDVCGSP